MLRDRDVIEENMHLLLRKWRHISIRSALNDPARLGMAPEMAHELRSLDEIQVRRAADCATPLFRFAQPDEVLIKVLRCEDQRDYSSHLRDEVDEIVEESNLMLLMNRWNGARVSPVHSQCVLAMSGPLIDALKEATVSDLKQAARRGIRLAKLAPRPRYLFHAGRNPSLQRSNRTILAVCTASGVC